MTFGNYDVSTAVRRSPTPSGGSYDGQSWYLINNQYQVNKTRTPTTTGVRP
jgi:serralysin